MGQPASPGSLAAFLAICGAVLVALLASVWRGTQRISLSPAPRTLTIALVLLVWLAGVGRLVSIGWVEAERSHLLIFGASNIILCIILSVSSVGDWVIKGSSIPTLLAFQGFRLPLELVLHTWVRQGVIPEAMTWTGSNWDILSGIAAVMLAPASRRRPLAAWLGNIFGIVLLLNVARVAAKSALAPENSSSALALQLPYHLPYAYIIPVCVGGALAGHIILSRALFRQRSLRSEQYTTDYIKHPVGP